MLSFKYNNSNTDWSRHSGSAGISCENGKTFETSTGQQIHNNDTISSLNKFMVDQNKRSKFIMEISFKMFLNSV